MTADWSPLYILLSATDIVMQYQISKQRTWEQNEHEASKRLKSPHPFVSRTYFQTVEDRDHNMPVKPLHTSRIAPNMRIASSILIGGRVRAMEKRKNTTSELLSTKSTQIILVVEAQFSGLSGYQLVFETQPSELGGHLTAIIETWSHFEASICGQWASIQFQTAMKTDKKLRKTCTI